MMDSEGCSNEDEIIEAIIVDSGCASCENSVEESLPAKEYESSKEKRIFETSLFKDDIVYTSNMDSFRGVKKCSTLTQNPDQNNLSEMNWIHSHANEEWSLLSNNISSNNDESNEQAADKEKMNNTDDICSGVDEEMSNHDLMLKKNQFSGSGDSLKNSDFSDDFGGMVKQEPNDQEGGFFSEVTATSNANGSPSFLPLESDMEHDNLLEGALELEKVSRKRKEKNKRQNEPPSFPEVTNTREKRSAFKKCTEWFKQLRGEMEARYFCASCNEVFSSKRDLKVHEFVHDVKKLEPTDFGEEVNQPNEVMTKCLESQNDASFECKECQEHFSSKSGLTRHQMKHTGLTLHFCKQCDRKFLRKETLAAHMRTHTSSNEQPRQNVTVFQTAVSRIRKLKCDQCDARFTQQWSLEQHQVIHTRSVDYYECKECNERFPEIPLLVKHQRSHSYQKSYQCGECDQRFSHKTKLYKHQLTHVEKRKAECPECNIKFAERSQLKIHYFTVHGTENLCVCTQCNKTFSKQVALKRHLLTHSDKAPFKCPVCKETFAQKSTLTRHSLLHGGEQFYRFVCSVCDRKFSRRETLNDHVRTHTGEKPFVCGVCHEGFSQKSAMKRHQILHFKEKRGKNSLPQVDVDSGVTEDILLSLVYSDA